MSSLWKPEIEFCGIITPEGEILETKNLAADPSNRFEFDIKDLEGAQATWHTHPETSANLSIADYGFFQSWPSKTHFIISSTEVRCYQTSNQLVLLIDEEEDLPPRTSS